MMNSTLDDQRDVAVACGACGASYQLHSPRVGDELECPNCRATLIVDAAGEGIESGVERETFSAARAEAMWSGAVSGDFSQEATIKPDASGEFLEVSLREFSIAEGASDGELGGDRADFILLDFLGHGGMGVVYKARQTTVNREVALKVIREDMAGEDDKRGLFLREAVVTGNLEHPNIVPVHDLGVNEDGTVFYTMKEVKGRPWHKRFRSMTLVENVEILMRVCDAVAYAHGKGIIHRDLKLENVMIGEFGEVMVMDWGLAVASGVECAVDGVPPLDPADARGGTPAYMSPEMAACRVDLIGPASDVYLLGGALYEIVTGLRPHAGDDSYTCIYAAMENIIQSNGEKGEFVDLALRAMVFDPADRPKSVKEFQAELRACLEHLDSVKMAEMAGADLSRGRDSGNYADFSQALLGFREALKMWPDNQKAALGAENASYEYAALACAKNDLDLAESLLSDESERQQALSEKVRLAKRSFRRRRLRTRTLTISLGVLVLALFVIMAYSNMKIHSEQVKALEARDDAQKAERAALRSLEKAERETRRALKAEERSAKLLAENERERKRVEEMLDRLVDARSAETMVKNQLALRDDQLRNSRETWYDLGLHFLKKRDLDAATKVLSRSVDYDPKNVKGPVKEALKRFGPEMSENQLIEMARQALLAKNDFLLDHLLEGRDYAAAAGERLERIVRAYKSFEDSTFPSVICSALGPERRLSVAVRGDYRQGINEGEDLIAFDLVSLAGLPIDELRLSYLNVIGLDEFQCPSLRSLAVRKCRIQFSKAKTQPFKNLRTLSLRNSRWDGSFSEFDAPRLSELDVSFTPIRSLKPFASAPLITLDASFSRVDDLRPIQSMPLERLFLSNCDFVKNVEPLLGLGKLRSAVLPMGVFDQTPKLKKLSNFKEISFSSKGKEADMVPFEKHLRMMNAD